jgi:hypothetical protein
MPKSFNQNWNRVDAVLALFVGWPLLKKYPYVESRLQVAIPKAFEGMSARLKQDQDLVDADKAQAVTQAVSAIAVKMEELKLSNTIELPAVLWMRLATELGLAVEEHTLRRFGAWYISKGTEGAWLLQSKLSNNEGPWRSPNLKIKGWDEAAGYTPIELLLAKKVDEVWPYDLQWQTVFVKRVIQKAMPAARNDQLQTPPVAAPAEKSAPTAVGSGKAARLTPQQRAKAIAKRCGSLVIAEMNRCLEKDAQTDRRLVSEVRKKDNRYSCQYSINTLADELRARYSSLCDWEKNTLMTALRLSVKCPRGRPGGLLEPVPELPKVKKKVR